MQHEWTQRTSLRGQWPVEEGGTELEAEEGELEEGDTELEEGELVEEGELAGAAELEATLSHSLPLFS